MKLVSSVPSVMSAEPLTFSDTPNSLSMRANTAARFKLECDSATSTMSNRRHIGELLTSKWTVTAMNALWFGEVHASVAKLRLPLCSLNECV